MGRQGCRWDSGCSASRTGLATAPSRSMRPSRHATSRRCRATSTSRWARACRSPGSLHGEGLFQHGRVQAGQSVLAHGAAGAVGSIVTQLAREAGAHVIGTGRAADRQKALDFGAQEFLDLTTTISKMSAESTWCSISSAATSGSGPRADSSRRNAGVHRRAVRGAARQRRGGRLRRRTDRAQLREIVQRVRDGRLRTNIGTVSPLDDAVAAFNSTTRRAGKT